uniref:Reverse transcriptase Ty1/copia-type domain-containing protein n=1 Tax=Tanacetum cinerariifolium TaxID=118510 RepID=A0A6L2NGE1_TANCI|nr:hypothetical protein [Tanacetum cinerariifolium]
MRIEQYIQMIDYSLWEVIENGNSLPKTQTVEGVETVMPITFAEDKAKTRLEVKARSTLMMGIPNEHQLKFNSIKDAKLMFEAIKKRNKPDLDSINMDDLYKNLKVYEPEVKGVSSSITNTQNMVNATNSTNIDNLSDAIIYAFLASQSNSSQLLNEDLEQSLLDNLEEMDLKWQMVMLTMRARRFLKNKRRKLNLNGNETVAFDKTKVEYYNFHKKGHFSREIRAPRAQDNRNKESTRRDVPVEITNSSALVSYDGIRGYDWSDQAKEGPNYALIAYSTSSSDSESLNKLIDSQIVDNCKKGLGYNTVPPPHTGLFMPSNPDLSYIGLEEFTSEPPVETFNAKTSKEVPKIMKKLMEDMLPLEVTPKEEKSLAKQNGVAERRNKTLIEASKTMLADSKLPTTFWAEAVSTACYVQNRVLFVKPHNKTHYALFHGRTPMLSFMRPFGCLVTILNTIDHLGKFDEGFFVRYSLNSKAFRVFNSRTKIVEETLHIRFSENTPNNVGSRPNWLFNIDALTKVINYQPVVAGTQSNGNAGVKDNNNAEPKSSQDAGFKPSNDVGKKNDGVNCTNRVNVVSSTVNAASNEVNAVGRKSSIKLPDDPNMPELEDISIFEYSNEDVFGVEADLNNLESTFQVSPIPTTRIHKDHPIEQVIRDLYSAPQTRRMSKNLEERGLVSIVNQRTNHKNLQKNLFACFLLQMEPKKLIQALKDPSWIERAIGSKWVFRNKLDERGIVIRNKARLVAHGHTQEEGIDYDEVFAPVARIVVIRLFLAYALFKDFVVYQMNMKSAFLYGKIEEEVYVCQPSRFEDPDFPDKVYKVEKELYGLHQAPRAWYETLSTYLLENGFHRGKIDKTLFIKRYKDDILLVQVYVDDIIFGSTKKELPTYKEKYDVSFHTKKVFANMNRIGKGFFGKETPLFPTMVGPNQVQIGRGDSLVRATTTASSLEAEHDSGNIDNTQTKAASNEPSSQGTSSGDGPRRQDTMRDTSAHTRRVNKLEKKHRSRTHKLKRLYKVGFTARVISSSDDEALDKEDTSKQERIDEIDADEDSALVSTHDDVSSQDNIVRDEGIKDVGEEEVVKVVTTAKMIIDAVVDAIRVTTAIADIPVSVAETIVTTALTIIAESIETNVKDKGKGKAKLIEELEMPKKKKYQIRADKELAEKLQAEMQAKIDKDDMLAGERAQKKQEANYALINTWDDIQAKIDADAQRKFFAAKRDEEKRNRPPTKAQQRSLMFTYLKNMDGWKPKALKNKSFAKIQELFDKAMKRINTFVDFRPELVEESKKKDEAETAQESSSKREGDKVEQEISKKQKVEDDKESEELKKCLEIIPDNGDDVTIDATPLFVNKLLKNFDREDLKVLWRLVKDIFVKTKPVDHMDSFLMYNLKTMFEHHVEDNNILYYLLVEKMYPLTHHTLNQNFNNVKLQVDYECEMAYELLRLIKKQLKEGYKADLSIWMNPPSDGEYFN